MEKMPGVTFIEAMTEINVEIEKFSRTGAATTEFNDACAVKQLLIEGRLTPQRAVELIRKVEGERQDYH